MFLYLWEFRVAPEHEEAFLAAYGSEGPWVRLFRRDPDYLGTELGREAADARRFVTVDRWRSRAACESFRARFAAEIAALDEHCGRLTVAERHLGDFELAP